MSPLNNDYAPYNKIEINKKYKLMTDKIDSEQSFKLNN